MKSLHLLSLTLLASTTLAPLVRADLGAVSPISLLVEQTSDDKRARYDETQKKTLKITLTNGSAQDQTVKVKYYYFAKDVKDHTVTVFKDGEKTATIKAHATEVVEAETVTAQSTEKHKGGDAKNPKGNAQVDASGQRLMGYGVQIFQDDKLGAEYFSEPSLKTNIGGGAK